MRSKSNAFRVLILPSSSVDTERIALQMQDYPFLPAFTAKNLDSCIIASSEEILKFADMVAKFPGVDSVLVGKKVDNLDVAAIEIKDMIMKLAEKKDKYAIKVRCLDSECNETDVSMLLTSKCIDLLSPLGFKLSERDAKLRIDVAVASNLLFVSYIQKAGLGGKEFGSAGKAVIMFKGDINCLLATLYLLKLGFYPILVAAIDVRSASKTIRQIVENACLVREYIPVKEFYLHLIPVRIDCLSDRVEIRHGYLREVAELVASANSAVIIATGITMDNATPSILSIYHKSKFTVVHPLLSMDKQDISKVAPSFFGEHVKPITSDPLGSKISKEFGEETLKEFALLSVRSSVSIKLANRSLYNTSLDEAMDKLQAAVK
ncbi:MAG: hypothetical protein QXV84_06035 [Conexivisphaerales archaeon]